MGTLFRGMFNIPRCACVGHCICSANEVGYHELENMTFRPVTDEGVLLSQEAVFDTRERPIQYVGRDEMPDDFIENYLEKTGGVLRNHRGPAWNIFRNCPLDYSKMTFAVPPTTYRRGTTSIIKGNVNNFSGNYVFNSIFLIKCSFFLRRTFKYRQFVLPRSRRLAHVYKKSQRRLQTGDHAQIPATATKSDGFFRQRP